MCLIAFAIGASTRWPLVVAANRDEFLDRPTLPLCRWTPPSGHDIVSGRDVRAGGTWMGVSPGGRVAFLTNVREPDARAAPRSRGELVTRWLEDSGTAPDFAVALEPHQDSYGGFNLVIGDYAGHHWMWLTNRSRPVLAGAPAQGRAAVAPAWHVQALPPGIYGLSNAGLNTPWPKTVALQHALTAALTAHANAPNAKALQASLWAALASRERAPHHQLPATGVPLALEEALSSAFVVLPEQGYGTRSSTVMVAGAPDPGSPQAAWRLEIEEQTYGGDGLPPRCIRLAMALGR